MLRGLLCECCGQPSGVCPNCGISHIPSVDRACEVCVKKGNAMTDVDEYTNRIGRVKRAVDEMINLSVHARPNESSEDAAEWCIGWLCAFISEDLSQVERLEAEIDRAAGR